MREDFNFLIIGLERDRRELYERIDRRVAGMFRAGLAREFTGLLRQGFAESDPGMRGIGYREFFSFLKSGCLRLKDLEASIQADSRRYAKRQLTFFRSLPGVHWLHPDREDDIRALVSGFLRTVRG
jgi:tRNA dimethylallyltransferase